MSRLSSLKTGLYEQLYENWDKIEEAIAEYIHYLREEQFELSKLN